MITQDDLLKAGYRDYGKPSDIIKPHADKLYQRWIWDEAGKKKLYAVSVFVYFPCPLPDRRTIPGAMVADVIFYTPRGQVDVEILVNADSDWTIRGLHKWLKDTYKAWHCQPDIHNN